MADGRKNRWYYAYADDRQGRFQMEKNSDHYKMTAIFGIRLVAQSISVPDYYHRFRWKYGEDSRNGGFDRSLRIPKTETELDLTGLSGTITISFTSSVEGKRGVAVNPVIEEAVRQ